MNPCRLFTRFGSCTLVLMLLFLPLTSLAQKEGEKPNVLRNPDVLAPVYPEVLDVDLRTLDINTKWKPGDPIKEIPRRQTSNAVEVKPDPMPDPLRGMQQTTRSDTRALSGPILNFDGQGFSGVTPPDPVGDVGIDYYIQSINAGAGARYTIYNKSDGSVAAGPFTMDLLGSSFCGSGQGDPIILYDELASRWLISEFSSSGNRMCVYISQTSDPIAGGWYNYAFQGNTFPDYPKYGVWPDAYYVGTNEATIGLYAFDRNAMLSGLPATAQRFSTSKLSGFNFQMLQPADLDGATAPPSGSPGIFIRHRDTEVHAGLTDPSNDYLELFEMSVDFTTPANSTLTGPIRIAISEIDSSLCGLTSFSCIPQPSGPPLDPLREVVMRRLAYRNMGSHEVLVGNLATDVNGSDLAGIRWFELRRNGAAWSLHQEGTYAPDSVNRWMGSIAMDASGNIALGYNAASASVFPGLRYVGRLDADPLGTMTMGEFTIVSGSGSNSSIRYGDYSSMNVDPVDGCTFWFTGEYNASSLWSTRIASFRFDECDCTPPPTPTGLGATPNGVNQIDLSWTAVTGATSYNIYRADGACPAGSYTLLASSATTSYSDTAVSGGQTYAYVVTAHDGTCESAQSACADATATGVCTTPPSFAGADSATNGAGTNCAITVSWSPGSSNCGGTVRYNVYRDTAPGFTPGNANLIASCLNATSYTDTNVTSGVAYTYIVRAEDTTLSGSGPCNNGIEETNSVEVTATASGPTVFSFSDDFEGALTNFGTQGSGGSPWVGTTSAASSPVTSAFCADEASLKDQSLVLVADQTLPAGTPAILTFDHWYATEAGYDGGVLEYSTDAGATWSDIGTARITQNNYNSTISTAYSSPISGRRAWSGDSGGFIQTSVDLSDFAGSTIRFRWRMACDTSVGATGWWVDDIAITATDDCVTCTYSLSPASISYSSLLNYGWVSVTAPSTCSWRARSNNRWIRITNYGSGIGNGTVDYVVLPNFSSSSRIGSITIAGQDHKIGQAGSTGRWHSLYKDDFESGFGSWKSGGVDCFRIQDSPPVVSSGRYAIALRDDTGKDATMFSDSFDATPFVGIRILGKFFSKSMEPGEDFYIEIYDGTTWHKIANYASGRDFKDGTQSKFEVIVPYTVPLTSRMNLAIRCDASDDHDYIVVDDVVIQGFR